MDTNIRNWKGYLNLLTSPNFLSLTDNSTSFPLGVLLHFAMGDTCR